MVAAPSPAEAPAASGRRGPAARILSFFRQDAPPDSPDEELRRQALVLSSLAITILATLWVATYAALGLWLSAAIPAFYQGLTVAGLLRLRAGGSFERFRTLQLSTMLVFPFLLQWTLGGAAPSGAVMLWGLVAPLGALVFWDSRAALAWLAAFLALTSVSGALEAVLAPAEVPAALSRAFFVLNAAAIGTVVFGVLRYFLEGRRRALAALAAERARSERLLRAILPEEIAERLKRGEEVIADAHGEVGVLFADLVGFTELGTRTAPRELVALLDDIFGAFDRLAEVRGVEKIKTLGDGYLAVAGVPHARPAAVDAVAGLALDLRDELRRIAAGRGADLSVRIGIDAGPLVAGVIGRRRFGYDVWGDTVNTASRMQALAPPGGIYLTERAARRLSEEFRVERQAERPVKGKGVLTPYALAAAATTSEPRPMAGQTSVSSTTGRGSGGPSPSS